MSEMMDIVAVVGERKAEVLQIPKPIPKEDEVLVKILGCGMCTFEQRVYAGVKKMKLPFAGGHEIAGIIEELGPGVKESDYPFKQKLVARTMKVCGACYYCRYGAPNMCINKSSKFMSEQIQPAGLGQYIVLNVAQVYMVPQNLPVETMVFAEPLACVINSIDQGRIGLGDDVVVIGGGVMGLLHIQVAKAFGATVILSEVNPERRKLGFELGADIVINPLDVDPVVEVKRLTGRGADAVFNTTAIAEVAYQAIEMTAPLGRCVMYSSVHPDVPIEMSPNNLHGTQKILTGAVSTTVESFARSAKLLSKGMIKTEKLLSGSYHYTDATSAFEQALQPETFRIMMRFCEGEK